jgi:hypothetical protein
MKRFVLLLAVIGISSLLYAQNQLPEYRFASGNWTFIGDRLYQNDARAPLAKVNFRASQDGVIVYEFSARYEDGAEDGHGGFGLHIFGDSAYNSASWGSGKSYLLWLNYDEKPISRDIPKGLSAQVYRSYTNSRMDLVESIDLNEYADLLTTDNLSYVPFRIVVDGNSGEVRVYDPTDSDLSAYYYFYINNEGKSLQGNWAALRTNGIKLSFAYGL